MTSGFAPIPWWSQRCLHRGARGGPGARRYTYFGWAEILIPFASAWQPGAVAWGIVAFYLLLAVQVTSMFMRRIPRKWWKLIHLSSYGLFWAGIVHGATAGTDAGQPLHVAASALGILGVLFLTVYRVFAKRRPTRPVSRGELRGLRGLNVRQNSPPGTCAWIRPLRKKIDLPYGRQALETVRGAGYRLEVDGG